MGAVQDESKKAEKKPSLNQERVEALRKVGVAINHDEEWVGEVGKGRHPVTLPETVKSVWLPLSPEEWCSIAMREGDNYMGGCCGNMGALQDTINEVFRDSGTVENPTLLGIGELARDHDGFDEFSPLSDDEFFDLVSRWDKLGPWGKIGVVYNGVEPVLAFRRWETPSNFNDDKDSFTLLNATLSNVNWQDLYTIRDENKEQHEATRLVSLDQKSVV